MASAPKPPTFTVSTLARAWDVDQAQVSRWKAGGMPFTRHGRITLPAATAWLREHERRERPGLKGDAAGERRSAIEVELLELRLARERGDVVLAAEVREAARAEAERVVGVLARTPTEDGEWMSERTQLPLSVVAPLLRDLMDRVQLRLARADDEGGDGDEDADDERA